MANHRVARLNLGRGGNIDQGHVVGQFDVLRFRIGLVLPVLILVVTHDDERGGMYKVEKQNKWAREAYQGRKHGEATGNGYISTVQGEPRLIGTRHLASKTYAE